MFASDSAKASGGPRTSYGTGFRPSGRLRHRKHRRIPERSFGRRGSFRPPRAVAARIVGCCHGRRCHRRGARRPVIDRIAPGTNGVRRSGAPAANPVRRQGKPERGAAAGLRHRNAQQRPRPVVRARHRSGTGTGFGDRRDCAAKFGPGMAASHDRACDTRAAAAGGAKSAPAPVVSPVAAAPAKPAEKPPADTALAKDSSPAAVLPVAQAPKHRPRKHRPRQQSPAGKILLRRRRRHR